MTEVLTLSRKKNDCLSEWGKNPHKVNRYKVTGTEVVIVDVVGFIFFSNSLIFYLRFL